MQIYIYIFKFFLKKLSFSYCFIYAGVFWYELYSRELYSFSYICSNMFILIIKVYLLHL